MTYEEAQRVMTRAACRCDGYGVLPGRDHSMPCPDCDGIPVASDELHQAMSVLNGVRPE